MVCTLSTRVLHRQSDCADTDFAACRAGTLLKGPGDAKADGAGQRGEIGDPRARGTSIGASEGLHEACHPHHRPRPRGSDDHPDKHGLQHEAMVLA